MKQVSVLVGAGSIGQAMIRRVPAGKHIVLADYSKVSDLMHFENVSHFSRYVKKTLGKSPSEWRNKLFTAIIS